MTRNPSQYPMPTQSQAAQPCPQNLAGAFNKQPLKNDTPDATGGCAAWRQQSQCRRDFAPTTARREAHHGQTTLATN